MTHYETLGIAKEATQDEIKQAYRKLAMMYHPDRNRDNKEAEEKFKAINEANEILSDESKRQAYDRGGQPFGQGGFQGFGSMEDVINQMFGQHFNQHGFTVFRNGVVQNRDITLGLTISLEDAYEGKQIPVKFNVPSGRVVELLINVPSGVESGVKIRYQGQGDQANSSLPPGDLYVVIQINEHQTFHRTGTTLETKIKVDAITAMVGGKVKVACIDGTILDIPVPAGTQPFSKIRVSKRGMPLHPGLSDYGDMLVITDIQIPANLTQGQLEILRTIQTQRGLDKSY